MKGLIFVCMTVITGVIMFSACSSDNTSVASYFDGKKTVHVKLGEIKKVFLDGIESYPMLAGNSNMHVQYIKENVIVPDIIKIEQISAGYTNTPEFQRVFSLISYSKRGKDYQSAQISQITEDVARASHILLYVYQYTNINNATRKLTDSELALILKDKQALAQTILDSLQSSKNLVKDFSNTAVLKSEDPGSAHDGGDLGYFIRGTMVKEFDDAIFNAKKTGLIETPVKSDYGFHIIDVTDLPRKMTLKQYEALIGKEKYATAAVSITNSILSGAKNDNFTNYYKVDFDRSIVTVDGKDFTVSTLPSDTVLFKIYGKPYTWKDSLETILLLVPTYTNKEYFGNIEYFNNFMNSLGDLLFYRDFAVKTGLDKQPVTDEQMKTFNDGVIKQLAYQKFNNDLISNITAQISPKDIESFYNETRTNYTKTINKAQVQLSLAEAMDSVKKDLISDISAKEYENWKNNIESKYRIVIDNGGLKTLYNLEFAKVRENQKKNPPQQGQGRQQQEQLPTQQIK